MGEKVKEKLSLREIRNSLGALNEIGKKEGLDFKLNYRIAKNCKNLEPIVKAYESSLQKFFKENGKYDKASGGYMLDPKDESKVIEFQKTNEELLEEEYEAEIDKIQIGRAHV